MRHIFLQSYIKLQGISNNNASWLPHEDDLIFHLQRKNIGWGAGKKCEIRFWKCFHHKCALFKSQYCPWSWRITCCFQNNSRIPFFAYVRVKATRLLKQTKNLYITRCQMNNVSVNVFPVLRVSLDPLVSLFFFLSSIPPGILQRRSLWRAHHEWLREPAKNYFAELVCKGDALFQKN